MNGITESFWKQNLSLQEPTTNTHLYNSIAVVTVGYHSEYKDFWKPSFHYLWRWQCVVYKNRISHCPGETHYVTTGIQIYQKADRNKAMILRVNFWFLDFWCIDCLKNSKAYWKWCHLPTFKVMDQDLIAVDLFVMWKVTFSEIDLTLPPWLICFSREATLRWWISFKICSLRMSVCTRILSSARVDLRDCLLPFYSHHFLVKKSFCLFSIMNEIRSLSVKAQNQVRLM